MNERVLKNDEDFLQWKNDCDLRDDLADKPTRYPCLARTYVSDWQYQEETAEYLFREDILSILNQFDA